MLYCTLNILPFFITCLGSLDINYYLDIGDTLAFWTSYIPCIELSFIEPYVLSSMSITFISMPYGCFCFRI